jgi:hypothetical protein
MTIIEIIQTVDLKYSHSCIYMESMEIEQPISLANLTRTSALPMNPSIAMNPIPSIEILNTMTWRS